MRRAEGGSKICGVFRVKNYDFTQKNYIFSNFRGGAPAVWQHLHKRYISQLICYSIACGSYHEFIERGYSHQGCCWTKGSWCLCWTHHFETFKVHDLINRYGCHKWSRICSVCCNHNVFLSSFMTYHSVCNTTCANNGTGTVPFRNTWVQPRFFVGFKIAQLILVFCVVFSVEHCLFLFLLVNVFVLRFTASG